MRNMRGNGFVQDDKLEAGGLSCFSQKVENRHPSQDTIDDLVVSLSDAVEQGHKATVNWVIDYARAADGILNQAQREKTFDQTNEQMNWHFDTIVKRLKDAGYDADYDRFDENDTDQSAQWLVSTSLERMESGRLPMPSVSMIAQKMGVTDSDSGPSGNRQSPDVA